jgi:hypothetical protein
MIDNIPRQGGVYKALHIEEFELLSLGFLDSFRHLTVLYPICGRSFLGTKTAQYQTYITILLL